MKVGYSLQLPQLLAIPRQQCNSSHCGRNGCDQSGNRIYIHQKPVQQNSD